MKFSFACIFLLVLGVSRIGFTQTINTAGFFPTLDFSGKFAKKSEYGFYYFVALPLVSDNSSLYKTPDALLFYTEQSYTYGITSSLSATGSYVYQEENAFRGSAIRENRLYGQLTYKHAKENHQFKHRLRHDSRFFENAFKHRLRYQFAYQFKFKNENYLSLGQEFFFELTKGASKVYNENWFNASYGIHLNERNKLEVGMLYVTWNTGNKSWFNQFYLQTTWVNQLNFRK